MSLVLSLCATSIPLTNSALYRTSPLILILYIFIDIVIYSYSSARHTRIHTYTSNFFLSVIKHPRHILHLLYQACLYINKLTQTACIRPMWLLPDAPTVASMLSLCGLRWGWGLIRAQSLLAGVSEVSVDEKATCHFGSGWHIWFFFNPPFPPGLSLQGRPCPTGIRRDKVVEPKGLGWAVGRRELHWGAHKCMFGSLPPQTLVVIFLSMTDVEEEASEAIYNVSVDQGKERAEQWCNNTSNS